MNVLLFGPPGSGKGTQASALSAALSVPHVATGDIFRKNLKEGTALGQLARSFMDTGGLVPDAVTCDMVAARLAEPDCGFDTERPNGVLLDGFPRSAPQTEWLIEWLRQRTQAIDAVVHLVVPREAVLARISGRRSCMSCGATYHVVSVPPAVPGWCDRCGQEVVQRKDDAEAVVQDRLSKYASETAAALPLLRAATTVYDLDGVGSVEEIRGRVFASLRLA